MLYMISSRCHWRCQSVSLPAPLKLRSYGAIQISIISIMIIITVVIKSKLVYSKLIFVDNKLINPSVNITTISNSFCLLYVSYFT